MTETFTRDSDGKKFIGIGNFANGNIEISFIHSRKPDRIQEMEERLVKRGSSNFQLEASKIIVECVLAILHDRGVLK